MPPVDQVFCVVTKVVPTPSFLERAGLDVASQPCRISWRRQRSSFRVNHVKYLMLLKFLPQSHVLTGCSEYLSSAQRKTRARWRQSDALRAAVGVVPPGSWCGSTRMIRAVAARIVSPKWPPLSDV